MYLSDKRQLGQTGLLISPLIWGTVKIGRNQGVKYPTQYTIPDLKEVANLLAIVKDAGINALDTAPAYGASEVRLGQLLKNQRQDWVIISKAGENFFNGESSYSFDKQSILKSVENSLRNLGTDFIDVLLIHSDGNDDEIIERHSVFETLTTLKQAGKIRSFGMSTKTVSGGLKTLQYSDVAMVTHNLEYKDELPVIEAAAKLKKGILIKKAFGSGHLVQDATLDSVSETFKEIFSHPGATAIVMGSINANHIKENIEKLQRVLGI